MKYDMTQRSVLLDVLKGGLIILVLLGHAIQYGSGAAFTLNHFWDNIIVRFIYSFHMPLFMAVAGYLSYFSLQKHGTKKYICQRWARLFPPIVLWGIGVFIFHCIKKHLSVFSWEIVRYLLICFWFLWSLLFSGTVVACAVHWRRPVRVLLYVFLIVLSLFSPDGYIWALHKFMFPCFLIGFYTAKYQLYDRLKSLQYTVIGMLLWVAFIPFFQKNEYIYTSGFSLISSKLPMDVQFSIDIFRYVIAGVASISVVGICNLIIKPASVQPLTRFLSYCGKNSLAIYILSTYQFVYVLTYLTKKLSHNFFINVVETLIILGICILIQRILTKSKLLSRLIIGK